MTKEQTIAIPEDLYNLTQLAEVTLAACKLSTTNISEIKDYINSSKRFEDADQFVDMDGPQALVKRQSHSKHADARSSASACHDGPNMMATVTLIRAPSTQRPCVGELERDVKLNCYASTTSTSGSLVCTSSSSSSASSASSAASCLSSMSSSSSDEEVANYYSHKVFDRKKLRRSTISEHSRYDELSCSSIPSCSGDEHSQSHAHSHSQNQTPSHIQDPSQQDASKGEHSLGLGLGLGLGTMDDEHVCPECGKKYSTSSNLARHRQTHRSIMDKKARRCPYCEKLYVSMPAFSMHVRTHSQGCKCQYCGKCFSRPWLLQGHIRTHTGEKPFKCGVCQKAFADKSNLRAHIQTHSNTKPHTCLRCGKSFALKSYLYKHEESSCMKNLGRSEKTSRHTPHSHASHAHLKLASMSGGGTKVKRTAGDSAKSTLASKLLQRKHNHNHNQANQTRGDPPYGVAYPLASPLTAVNISAFNLQNIMAAAEAQEPGQQHAAAPASAEKSYTVLTNSMSQEEYERFNRMSVIQPTAGAASSVAAVSASVTNATNTATAVPYEHDQLPYHLPTLAHASQSHPSACYSLESTIALKPQEQPVDFSPKNSFSHSPKSSAFELTGNYTIVA